MRTVVISSNDNDSYLFYVPIVAWAWRKFDWHTTLIMPELRSKKVATVLTHFFCQGGTVVVVPPIGYREETLVQCSRLYAGNFTNGMIMTSDSDMLPLSDYWNPGEGITCYGRDLSDRHQPMCYIAGDAEWWRELMDLSGSFEADIKRDLAKCPAAKSKYWTEWWQSDQDIITERISNMHVTNVFRGTAPNSHYPLGRIDRGAWERTLEQPRRIDAHLPREINRENFNKLLALINECFEPTDEELQWLENYYEDFSNHKDV